MTYSTDPFDRERFHRLREIASEVMRVAGKAEFQWPTEIGYTTPKVDVRGVVFRDAEVLLIKEASSGKWTLPGGWADVNLTPAENVERECLEETGLPSEGASDYRGSRPRSRGLSCEPALDL